MSRSRIPLPHLPFRIANAVEDLDIEVMSERLSNGRSKTSYRLPTRDAEFRSVSLIKQVGTSTIVANACTAVEFTSIDPAHSIVMLPLKGDALITQDKRQLTWRADACAAFLPAADTSGVFSSRSAVGIPVLPDLLEDLAARMLGRDPGGPALLDLSTPRELQLVWGSVRFSTAFTHLLFAIDQCSAAPQMLDRSGLDDALHRLLVMLLQPEMFLGDPVRPKPPRRYQIDDVCDYILANLDQKLTLSDLEPISGLSSRVLQYAFRERFGCSPMQWVNDQRLEQVRALIQGAPPGARVSAIASAYFSNLGDFAQRYRRRFGELPSVTMERRRTK